MDMDCHGYERHGHGPPPAPDVAPDPTQSDTMSNPHAGRIAAHTMQQEYRSCRPSTPCYATGHRAAGDRVTAAPLVTAALRDLLDAARDGIAAGGHAAGSLAGASRRGAGGTPCAVAAPRHQCHGRDRAHEFRPRAAGASRTPGRRPGQSRLQQLGVHAGRGHRAVTTARARCALTGAEDAMVVNNRAAAVCLTLAALCTGRRVLVQPGTTGGDRRRLSHPRRAPCRRKPAGRSGHHQPHPRPR
ncbi:MAG: hypothetical protein R2838_15210 [Caldilineaceae bacterium]